MTETTKTIFAKHQIRKSRKKKTAFIDYVQATAAAKGYTTHVEKGYFGARNIVVGNPEKAKVIYTAHYDTCARMPVPNFITPKSIWVYLLYQILLTVVLLGLPTLLTIGLGAILSRFVTERAGILILYYTWLAMIIAEMWLIMAGPANKQTANDNTSGVTTLLDIMTALPEDLRENVAFIFFDFEELGLFGSAGYASKHKNITKNTILLNFDCVSDGNTILFALRTKAAPYAKAIGEAFPETDAFHVEVVSKGVFYPSDQANFAKGVGVAALKKGKLGILYMDRIHTKHDTVYEEANIAYLTEGAIRLAKGLSQS